jgi:hypothetical protein
MKAWMTDQRLPSGLLYVGRFKDPMYFLTQSIKWEPTGNADQTLPTVTVPQGFVTDFASIPREFYSFLRPDGDYAFAAVVHDFLYWDQTSSREAADDTLKAAMTDFDIPSLTKEVIYKAVRLGGGPAWREDGRLKAGGEKRILKRFPSDPRITWAQWKQQPGVFN